MTTTTELEVKDLKLMTTEDAIRIQKAAAKTPEGVKKGSFAARAMSAAAKNANNN